MKAGMTFLESRRTVESQHWFHRQGGGDGHTLLLESVAFIEERSLEDLAWSLVFMWVWSGQEVKP